MITLNLATIAVHAVFFFAAMFFFTHFVLNPMVAIRDARCAATDGKASNATKWLSEAEAMEAQYRERMLTTRVELQAMRDKVRSAASARATELLAEARRLAGQQLEQAKTDIARQIDDAKQMLSASTEEFAGLIASRIVERNVQVVDDAVISEAKRVASIGKAH